jgi:hypothetical protein
MRSRSPLPSLDPDVAEESPLTLVAFMTTDDGILLAADSLAREENGTPSRVQKLYRLSGLPIAWGFSGEGLIGKPFRNGC